VGQRNDFSILRKLLGAIGVSPEATDDIIERINDFLFDKGEKSAGEPAYPYIVNKDFLSPAEHNFFSVLRTTVSDQATISTKVSLGDLFFVSSKDPSEFRIYRNKIDRKHVDFLLCDPKTVRPLVGIELDDNTKCATQRPPGTGRVRGPRLPCRRFAPDPGPGQDCVFCRRIE
jgi:hypothetical protein